MPKGRIEEYAAIDDLYEGLNMFEKTARVMFATVVLSGLCSLCATGECKAAREVWLDTLDVKLAQSGFSNSKRNRSIDNNPIRLAGVEYAHGVGTHPPGRFLIDLAGHAERFVALVGIDDERKTSGTAEFIVKGDGRVLFASGIMRGGQPPKRVDVDVRGVKLMELIVTVAGDGYTNDHTDWADAKIIMSGDANPRALRPPKRNEFGSLADRIADHAANGKSSQMLRVAAEVFRREALILDSDRDPVDIILRRTEALLKHIDDMPDAPDLSSCQAQLARFKTANARVDVADPAARETLFFDIAKLRRTIAFSNPLVNFDRILFIKRHFNPNAEKTGNHMCDQYFGFNAIAGGGLFILEHPFSDNPKVRNILENSVCENGRFKGRKLTSQGGFLSPDLSWDGKTILFAYTDIAGNPQRYKWTQDNAWHIFKVNVDGSGLRQLTDGSTNDFDPCLLPNGRIVFISERRGGYGRCHGRPVPSFTLHSMNPDGSDIVTLSPHETNEWHPSVDNNGMIIYTR